MAALPPNDNLSTGYEAGLVILTTVSVAVVWLRMYTRIFVIHQPGWDDWLMFIASFMTILVIGFFTTAFHYGVGRHVEYVSTDEITAMNEWIWAGEPVYFTTLSIVKISVSVFLLRLVPTNRTGFVLILRAVIVSTICICLCVSFSYLLKCVPAPKIWTADITGRCVNAVVLPVTTWLFQGVSIITDLINLILPIVLLKDLQATQRAKLSLLCVLCLGFLTLICAVVKTCLLPGLWASEDRTWNLAGVVLWASLELCIGMMCGSVPGIRPLFVHIPIASRYRPNSNFEHTPSTGFTEHTPVCGFPHSIQTSKILAILAAAKLPVGRQKTTEQGESEEELIRMRHQGIIVATTTVKIIRSRPDFVVEVV